MGLASRLRDAGLRPWLDLCELQPGRQWMPRVVEALWASHACAVIIGPAGLGDWAREELAIAQERAVKDEEFRLFMVLLPGSPDPLDPQLAFLNSRTWVDLRDGLDGPRGFAALLAAVRVATPDVRTAANASDVCPYRGLEVFDEQHRDFFFGRDDDIARAIEKLRTSRFLGLLGPSGSGKSSLARAGVIPALGEGRLDHSEQWSVRVLTPGTRPLTALAAQLLRLSDASSMQRTIDGALEDERTLDLAVELALAQRPPEDRFVLLVDQFEEVFTICRDARERDAFLANLVHAATIPGGRAVVITAMRADFYHRCAESQRLRRLLGEQQLLVGPLDAEGMRDAIELPAARVGLRLERGLSARIVADVRDQAGALPLVEHVMLELWRRREHGALTVAAYEEIGGVEEALSRRAEQVFLGLSDAEQTLARDALLRLVQPLDGATDIRRKATIGELVSDPADGDRVQAVIQAMADNRLVSVGRDGASGEPLVELAHEALIRGWPRLTGWIVEKREFLRERRRLADAAEEWQRAGRDPFLLLRGTRLAAWVERGDHGLNPFEREYLEASSAWEEGERRRGRRRVRLALAGLAGVTLIVAAIAVFAALQARNADAERVRARAALAQQYALTALTRVDANPQEAVFLAGESLRARPSALAETALRRAVAAAHPMVVLSGHQGPVTDVNMSRDHRSVVGAGQDGTVRVWQWRRSGRGRVVQRAPAPVAQVGFAVGDTVIYSLDDKGTLRVTRAGTTASRTGIERIALATDDRSLLVAERKGGRLALMDLTRPRTTARALGAERNLTALRWSRDGSAFVTGTEDGQAKIWTRAGKSHLIAKRADAVQSVTISPNGRTLVAAWSDGVVRAFDRHRPRAKPASVSFDEGVGTALFMPDDSDRVAIGMPVRGLVVWDLRHPTSKPEPLRGVESGTYWVQRDGPLLAYAEASGTIRVWDTHEEPPTPELLVGHDGAVVIAKPVTGTRRIVSGGADGTVRVWDPTPRNGHTVLTGAEGDEVRFSADDQRLLVNGVHLQSLPAGRGRVVEFAQRSLFYGAIEPSPDGRTVAVADDATGRVLLWDLGASDRPPRALGPRGARTVGYTRQRTELVVVYADGTVRAWDLHHLSRPPRTVRITGAKAEDDTSVSAGGGFVVTVNDGLDQVRAFDRARPAAGPVVLSSQHSTIEDVAFTHDDRHVAIAQRDGEIYLWDRSRPGRPVRRLSGADDSATSVTFSRDDRWLLSTGLNGLLRIWDWREENPVPVELHPPYAGPEGADISSDGTRVAAVDDDGRVHLWHCAVCGSRDALQRLSATLGTEPAAGAGARPETEAPPRLSSDES